MVLVLNHASGSFERQRSTFSFARHFGPGGVPLLSEVPEVDLPAEQVMHLAPVRTPRVIPRPEVLAAIDDVGMRYAGHPSLRAAGMSVTEWLSFFRANIEIESGYRQTAVSSVGAIGLGQLMPATAAKLGVNPNDMHQNLDGSARYMLMLLGRFGSKELALAGYNAGPGAVEKYGGIPPYPETQGHVRKVMSVFQKLTLATAE
ncbi:lytic transglycosylase domain-containing protein [Paracoccus shandongensis]|uniref:lytic transglycosylase domain-containing protein n=1 Tax=Paracoccus shandongensis TaxID=2816048 RepID=UPI001A8E097A|nr:lytic transglycosylase domain-containing protein [Paracoccus shandongensis]